MDFIAEIAHALQTQSLIRLLPETRQKIAANPNITFAETEDGGHCSFLAERAVVEFTRSV